MYSRFRSRKIALVLAFLFASVSIYGQKLEYDRYEPLEYSRRELVQQPPGKPGTPIINAPPAAATSISVPLTVQETLYSGGTSGVTRGDEPLNFTVPMPDNSVSGVNDVSGLGLTGASYGQFRELASWPSGRVKWVQVNTLLGSLSAGGTSTALTLTAGSGNFGGSNIATDNGTTITVATGATTSFTIKKANFNGFDQVVVNGTTVVSTGTSTGLVVMGPARTGVAATDTTCGTCTTPYTSANDSSSTATIEENGPVKAVILAEGAHKDGSGNVYMRYTVRMYFFKGQSSVRVTSTLRNADDGTSDSFETAFKGMAAYEWRTTAAISGTRNYRIAKDAGTEATGTMSGSNDIYVYNGKTDWMRHEWGTAGVPATNDEGWKVILNGNTGSPVDSGGITEHTDGWADIRDSSGVGVSIGIEHMHAWWDKSLEFKSGGSDVRIGIFSAYNSRIYHQAWPQWSTFDLYFNFHNAALSSPSEEFLKFQHALVARPTLAYFNSTNVWPHKIATATEEDAFYTATTSAANPSHAFTVTAIADASPAGTSLANGNGLKVQNNWNWASGGESNQQEWRIGWMDQWVARGLDARLLNAKYWYRFLTDDMAPHSDGFTWRSQTGEKTSVGQPNAASLNYTLGWRQFVDPHGAFHPTGGIQDHSHWYGMGLFYFLSGDELVKQAYLDGYADWSLDADTPQAGAANSSETGGDGGAESRISALSIINGIYMARFLGDVGLTSEKAQVLTNLETLFHADFDDVLCTTQEEAAQSCSSQDTTSSESLPGMIPISLLNSPATLNEGISRTRGTVWNGGVDPLWCGVTEQSSPGVYTGGWRLSSVWTSQAWWAWALYELAEIQGSSWSEYDEARSLALGVIANAEDEMWTEEGNDRWDEDGYKLYNAFDRPGNCANPPPDYDENRFKGAYCGASGFCTSLSFWVMYSVKYKITGDQSWVDRSKVTINKNLNYVGGASPDWYGWMTNEMIAAATAAPIVTLENLEITSVTHLGSGNYSLSWVVPDNVQSYWIKWGSKTIVEWIGFDEYTGTFVGNPTTTMPWFAATDVSSPPSPGTPWTTQYLTVSTGNTGLTIANFSLKAFCTGVCDQDEGIPTSIVWEELTESGDIPNQVTQTRMFHDLASDKMYYYSIRDTSVSIFATDVYFATIDGVWTRWGGTGDTFNSCPGSTSDTTPWPSNRHPDLMSAYDPDNKVLYQYSGLCQGGPDLFDLWTLTFNADHELNVWEEITPATTPAIQYGGSMAWDNDHDVLYLTGPTTGGFGYTYVYCVTEGIPACEGNQNDWVQLWGPELLTASHEYYQPGLYWDSSIQRLLLFRQYQESAGTWSSRVWEMDTTAGTPDWTDRAATSAPTNQENTSNSQQLWMQIRPGLYHFHRTANQINQTGQAADYLYTVSTNAFTVLPDTNNGPEDIAFCVFMSNIGTKGGALCEDFGSGAPPSRLWKGTYQQ